MLHEFVRKVNDGARSAPINGLWYGKIVDPLPADLSEMVYVSIPDIDSHTKFGPCRWTTSDIPALGAECLVGFDNRENIWVISIW